MVNARLSDAPRQAAAPSRARSAKVVLALGWLFSTSGCQYLTGAADLTVQSSADDQPNWSCRRHPPDYDPNSQVSYSQPIRNLADETIINDVSVKICTNSDLNCADPIVDTTPIDGVVSFDLDATFMGYIRLSSPEMMPAVVELTRPIGQMRVLPELQMVTPETFKMFSALVDVTPDPALGYSQFWIYDCDGKRASGVQVSVLNELGPTAQGYYVMDTKLPSTVADRTDASGASGFANLPPGVLTFVAKNAEDGSTISEFAARVQPGVITCAVIEPD